MLLFFFSSRRRHTSCALVTGVQTCAPPILRDGKIIVLADADSDGLHIATLLAAFFLRHFPALVDGGHIFVAMPPLFRVDAGRPVFYALYGAEKRLLLIRIEREKIKGTVKLSRLTCTGEGYPP